MIDSINLMSLGFKLQEFHEMFPMTTTFSFEDLMKLSTMPTNINIETKIREGLRYLQIEKAEKKGIVLKSTIKEIKQQIEEKGYRVRRFGDREDYLELLKNGRNIFDDVPVEENFTTRKEYMYAIDEFFERNHINKKTISNLRGLCIERGLEYDKKGDVIALLLALKRNQKKGEKDRVDEEIKKEIKEEKSPINLSKFREIKQVIEKRPHDYKVDELKELCVTNDIPFSIGDNKAILLSVLKSKSVL